MECNIKNKEGNLCRVEEVAGRVRRKGIAYSTLWREIKAGGRACRGEIPVCVCLTTCPASNDASDAKYDAARSRKTRTLKLPLT